MRMRIAIAALAALAACAEERRADTTNVTAPEIAAVEENSTAAGYAIAATGASGSWAYAESARAAWFGEPNAEARFSIACDQRARRLIFSRPVEARPGDAMTISTSSATRELAIVPASDGAAEPEAGASVAADDPWLDALARSEGAITVRIGAGEALTVPADPAIGRAVAACKPGETP